MSSTGFNPQARWDRHVPAQKAPHRPNSSLGRVPETEEIIAVTARFENGLIYPQQFTWHNREYAISRITYRWQERQGAARISYFSVACGSDLYQISFDNTSFGWRLDKVIN